jgi:hypothetical protein
LALGLNSGSQDESIIPINKGRVIPPKNKKNHKAMNAQI